MSRGTAALSTNRKEDPASAGAVVAAANGLSKDPILIGTVVLGQDPGDPLNPAALTSSREIPVGLNFVNFLGENWTGFFPDRVQIQTGAISIYGDHVASGANSPQLNIVDTASIRQLLLRVVRNSDTVTYSPNLGDGAVYIKFYPDIGTGCIQITTDLFENPPANILDFFTVKGNSVFEGYVMGRYNVRNGPPDEAVQVNESRSLLSGNSNVAAKTVFLPPAANLGVSVTIWCSGSQNIVVTPGLGDSIVRGIVVLAPGTSISSNVYGSCIELFVADIGIWGTKSIHGTWV